MDNKFLIMDNRIRLEKQNKRNDQVIELILDNCHASRITGLTEEFVNLEALSIINVGLDTLEGFPKLPNLRKLELCDNRLTGGLNFLHGSPRLQHLSVNGNKIEDIESLKPLKELNELVILDLYDCRITRADDYRQKVFELLPNLHSLDGSNRVEGENKKVEPEVLSEVSKNAIVCEINNKPETKNEVEECQVEEEMEAEIEDEIGGEDEGEIGDSDDSSKYDEEDNGVEIVEHRVGDSMEDEEDYSEDDYDDDIDEDDDEELSGDESRDESEEFAVIGRVEEHSSIEDGDNDQSSMDDVAVNDSNEATRDETIGEDSLGNSVEDSEDCEESEKGTDSVDDEEVGNSADSSDIKQCQEGNTTSGIEEVLVNRAENEGTSSKPSELETDHKAADVDKDQLDENLSSTSNMNETVIANTVKSTSGSNATTTPEAVPATAVDIIPISASETTPTSAPEIIPTSAHEITPTSVPEITPTSVPETTSTCTPVLETKLTLPTTIVETAEDSEQRGQKRRYEDENISGDESSEKVSKTDET